MSCGPPTASPSSGTPVRAAETAPARPGADPVQQALQALQPVSGQASSSAVRELLRAVEDSYVLADRLHGHLQLDKPLYRPGESVWFRLWELDAVTGRSRTRPEQPIAVQLLDPKGAIVVRKQLRAHGAVARGEIPLASSAVGGQYTLRLTSRGQDYQRPVTVFAYRTPLIKKRAEFLQDAYRAGERVSLAVALERATGEPFAKQGVTALLTLDGQQTDRVDATTDGAGRALLHLQLPSDVGHRRAMVTILVDAGGIVESTQKAVPLQTDDVEVTLFPEGGQLVAGLPGRVYFRATRGNGEPALVRGHLLDDQGRRLAEVQTLHEGMGRFAIVPEPGRSYRLSLTSKREGDTSVAVPAAQSSGCVLQSVDDFGYQSRHLRFGLWCTRERTVVVHAMLRGKSLGGQSLHVLTGRAHLVEIPVTGQHRGRRGVVRITAFDEQLQPLAERLVFRGAGAHGTPVQDTGLQVTIRSDRESYTPGERTVLSLETRDAVGQPVQADLSVAVVDDAALALHERPSTALPTAFHLLAALPDGTELREPDFYLSAAADAPRALDLVLGTHGWRRFVWQRVFARDQDQDRILDVDDHCPLEMEVYNGYQDEDGCPDAARVLISDNRIELLPAPGVEPPASPPTPIPDGDRPVGPQESPPRAQVDWPREERAGWALVREFPVPRRRRDATQPRRDFRQTVFWSPSIRTDPDGRAQVEFPLSDAITSFRVTVQGVSIAAGENDSSLAHAQHLVATKKPLSVSLTLPAEVTSGDIMEVPITVANETRVAQSVGLRVTPGQGLSLARPVPAKVHLAAGERETAFARVQVGDTRARTTTVHVVATAGGERDELEERLAIVPRGLPVRLSHSGTK